MRMYAPKIGKVVRYKVAKIDLVRRAKAAMKDL